MFKKWLTKYKLQRRCKHEFNVETKHEYDFDFKDIVSFEVGTCTKCGKRK